jgi:hypothetical protein
MWLYGTAGESGYTVRRVESGCTVRQVATSVFQRINSLFSQDICTNTTPYFKGPR